METSRILAGLNAQQLQAVTAPAVPVVCVAGAGSGKTRVLTRRIAYRVATGEIDPQRVVVTTFTNAAASELSDRLFKLGFREPLTSGTFHALALRQIKQRYSELGRSVPAIVNSQYGFLKKNLPKEFVPHLNSLINEFGWASSQLLGPETYNDSAKLAGRKPSVDITQVAELMNSYQQLKRQKHVMDMDDILRRAISDIASDDNYAAAIKWRHRHFFVDEFQDINPLQYELLSRWRQQRNDIFVVGDPAQAIYAWNGSDPDLISDFADMNRGAEVIELTENYRSSQQVLAAAKAVLPAALDLTANSPDGPVVEIIEHQSDDEESSKVATEAARAIRIEPTKSVIVLARTQNQLKLVSEELDKLGYDTEYLTSDRHAKAHNEEQLAPAEYDFESQEDSRPKRPSIPLGTFHSAKGLEWDTVFIVGAEEGYTPSSFATTNAQIEEEQRLLYVACTRAKRKLIISWAKARTFKKSIRQRQVSRFLKRVEQSQVTPRGSSNEDKISALRAKLGQNDNASRRTRIEKWRAERAKSAKVPESAVVPDRFIELAANAEATKLRVILSESGFTSNKYQRYMNDLEQILSQE